uniref:Uncharacterized protein n=1 Tax=Ciona intestinalis TaxID=7719 RepID=H2XRG6_CIOIN
ENTLIEIRKHTTYREVFHLKTFLHFTQLLPKRFCNPVLITPGYPIIVTHIFHCLLIITML